MALKPSEADHTQRLNFLHSAAHAAFKLCPQLASFYGNEFLTGLGEQRTSNTIMRQLCVYCGSPFVDGRSVKRVSVVSNTSTRPTNKAKHVKRKNKVQAIWLRPNEAHTGNKHEFKISREERMKQQRDLKNTIQYTCGMCSMRVIIPGTTRSALKEAKLGAKTHHTDTVQRSNEPMNIKVPQADPPAVALSGLSARKSEHPHTHTPTAQLASSTKTTAAIQGDTATKKRKRNKSNLLATVAANKKKVEEKKNADSSAFSLNDFLSSL